MAERVVIEMLRRRIVTVAAFIMVWALALAPSAHSAASVVRITAATRPKVTVTVGGDGHALRVRANIPWTILTEQSSFGGARVVEVFEGGQTSDAGRKVELGGRIVDFTVLANP